VLIVAIVKILAVWTALSVFLGFLIAPVLAGRLRKSDQASPARTRRQAVKARTFPPTPRLVRCVSRSPYNQRMAAAPEELHRRGQ